MFGMERRVLVGAIVVALGTAPQAMAQQGTAPVPEAPQSRETGSLTGRVFDPATGEYLRNARVRVASATGTQTVITGEGGGYRVHNLPAGMVELTVEFTGYAVQHLQLELAPGEARRQDVDLHSTAAPVGGAARTLDTLRVVGVREGDARALMEQRASMDITNSFSAES